MVSARLTPMTVHAAANLSSTAPSVVPGRVSNTPMEPLLRYSVHWRMATVGIGNQKLNRTGNFGQPGAVQFAERAVADPVDGATLEGGRFRTGSLLSVRWERSSS